VSQPVPATRISVEEYLQSEQHSHQCNAKGNWLLGRLEADEVLPVEYPSYFAKLRIEDLYEDVRFL
jgi:hypothetical protein